MGDKKKSANNVIIDLVDLVNANNIDGFYSSVSQYLDSRPLGTDYRKKLIKSFAARPAKLRQLTKLPDQIKNIIIQEDQQNDNVFINDSILNLINELSSEITHAAIYKAHNIPVRNKLLLHGPTGNGKTTIAKYIANKMKLPFIEISSNIIKSTLGTTASNIQSLFSGIQEPCVLFWDEIDSIGRERSLKGSDNASVENDRMVNAMLINISKMRPDVLFIGATNRFEILDAAFVRRFDLKYKIDNPGLAEKQHFAKQLTTYYSFPDFKFGKDLETLISYSDIKEYFVSKARKHILEKIESENKNQFLIIDQQGTKLVQL